MATRARELALVGAIHRAPRAKAILEQEAEGLFGIGVKLAALPTQHGLDAGYEQERATDQR
jgi:hypothetical protein